MTRIEKLERKIIRHKHPLYNRWQQMKRRCFNENEPAYKNYGGRGITVCNRWLDFDTYVKDMGLPPTKKHSVDRIDNDGNYEPSNCRWATFKEQTNNTRRNRKITHNGVTKNLSEWAVVTGLPINRLHFRLKKASFGHRLFKTQRLNELTIEYEGESGSLAYFSKKYGVVMATAWRRYRTGRPLYEVFSKEKLKPRDTEPSNTRPTLASLKIGKR